MLEANTTGKNRIKGLFIHATDNMKVEDAIDIAKVEAVRAGMAKITGSLRVMEIIYSDLIKGWLVAIEIP